MKFKIINTTDIQKTPYNPPSRIEERYIKLLKASIEKHGVLQPILITENFELIDGNRRLEASKRLGITKIPAIVLTDKDVALKDDIYVEVNETSKKLKDAEQLVVYLSGGKVSKRVENAIKNIEHLGGKEALKNMAKRKTTSPPHIWSAFTALKKYVDISDEKKAIKWLTEFETSYNIRRAIREQMSKEDFISAINARKPLQKKWTLTA